MVLQITVQCARGSTRQLVLLFPFVFKIIFIFYWSKIEIHIVWVVRVEIFMSDISICLHMFRFFSQLGCYRVLIRPPLVGIISSVLQVIDCICSFQILIYSFPAFFPCGNHMFDYQASDSIYVFPDSSWVCMCKLYL